MRVLAAYGLIFYGVLSVARVPSSVTAGRMAPAGGLVQALGATTMILAALGILLGLAWALPVAIIAVLGLSLLAGYHAWLVDGRLQLGKQGARTTLAVALIAMLVLGN